MAPPAAGKAQGVPSLVDRIRAFQKSVQANKRCANCTERGPTYVCLDFQTFVCQTCSGLHREFGHKIKSISFSEWTVTDVELLEAGGNERAAQSWQCRWRPEDYPEPESGDMDKIRDFIRQKFVEKRWYRPPPAEVAQPRAFSAENATAQALPDVENKSQALVDTTTPVPPPAPQVAAVTSKAAVADLLSDGPPPVFTLADVEVPVMEISVPLVTPPVATSSLFTNQVDSGWTASFGISQNKVAEAAPTPTTPEKITGLIDLDPSGFAGTPMVEAKAAPPPMLSQDLSSLFILKEPAEEPAPTPGVEGDEITLAERLRKAVQAGSAEELKKLYSQLGSVKLAEFAPLPKAKAQAPTEDRYAALASLDDVNKVQMAQLRDPLQGLSSMMQMSAPAVPAASFAPSRSLGLQLPTAAVASSKGPQVFYIGDDASPAAAEQAISQVVAGLPKPSQSSTGPPAVWRPPASVAGVSPVPAQTSTPNLAALTAQGPKLSPVQLEQMSPQDLIQMQAMISQALLARSHPTLGVQPPHLPASSTAPEAQKVSLPSPTSMSGEPEIVAGSRAQFGELMSAFQARNPVIGFDLL